MISEMAICMDVFVICHMSYNVKHCSRNRKEETDGQTDR